MYRIKRMFFKDKNGSLNYVVKRNITKEEALAHCNDKETSSKTCTLPQRKAITKASGPWFDTFERQ